MKAKLKSWVTKITIFDFLNKSDAEHFEVAREKFLKHLLYTLFIVVIGIFILEKAGGPLYLTVLVATAVIWQGSGRFVVNWTGFFENITPGYFVCGNDRRLKPAKYISYKKIEGLSCKICLDCVDEVEREFNEVNKKLEVERKRVADFRLKMAEIDKHVEELEGFLRYREKENIELYKKVCRLEDELKKLKGE